MKLDTVALNKSGKINLTSKRRSIEFFSCPVCDKQFKRKGGVTSHVNRLHADYVKDCRMDQDGELFTQHQRLSNRNIIKLGYDSLKDLS